MFIFSTLAIVFFLLPYPLSWFGYIKKADYDNPTTLEYACLSATLFSMFIALSHLIPPFLVLLIFIFLGGMVALGAIFALPLKIPSLQQKARNNRFVRFKTIALCVLLSVFSYSSLYSYSFGMGINPEGHNVEPVTSDELEENEDRAYQHEMGLRNLVFPLGIESCFSRIDEVCEKADQTVDFEEQAESNWFISLCLAFLNGFGTYAFAMKYTRQEKKDKSARFIVG